MPIEIVYILIALAYLSCFCAFAICFVSFDLIETPAFVMFWSFLWPIVFIGCLFALPFVAFVKHVKKEDNGTQKTL